MKTALTLFLLVSMCWPGQSQIDTAAIRAATDQLTDDNARMAYLKTLIHADQTYRGSDRNVSTDLHNLVALAYYLNTYGYPHLQPIENAPEALSIIWAHIHFRELRKLTFPIVHQAYLNGDISEKRLRSYYLRVDYQRLFDSENNSSHSLENLYTLLGFNTGSNIPIQSLIQQLQDIREFSSQPKKEVKRWQAAPKTKMVKTNGVMSPFTYQDSAVEIFTHADCKMYFREILADNSYEPRELQTIGAMKYKIKEQQTTSYFEINPEGNLVYRNHDMILEEYFPVK
jgi:hypothetical protein